MINGNKQYDLWVKLVLSFDGEDFHLSASNHSVELSSPSVRSGLRAMLYLNEHHQLLERSNGLNVVLKNHGWTVYAHSGHFKMAILGLKGSRFFMTALIYFGRLSRWVGAI